MSARRSCIPSRRSRSSSREVLGREGHRVLTGRRPAGIACRDPPVQPGIRATANCGRRARSARARSGDRSTSRCSRRWLSPSATGCGTRCTRRSPIVRTTRCSTTCARCSSGWHPRGISSGLISNFEAWLDDLLADLGVREVFAVRVISGIEGMEKPDPRIFRLALERAGIEATDAVYVGDNPEFDVDPPRGARDVPGPDRPPRAPRPTTSARGSRTWRTSSRRSDG